ncbi:MAG: hypothetical protein RR191_06230 [Cetobacterium sp.]|uniref:hypothetical protein n=1 Tax=Cetobacterium sp. TaxID=2071632 RepID=UPI002FC6B829
MDNLLNKLNLLSKAFNEATEIKSRLQDKPIPEKYIREYFKNLKYILKKYNDQHFLNIVDLYEKIVLKSELELSKNPILNTVGLTGAKILEKEIIKNDLNDVMISSVNVIIERTFNDIDKVIIYDKELMAWKDIRSFMLELTPIIKSKLKIRLKENSDYLKQIAECR